MAFFCLSPNCCVLSLCTVWMQMSGKSSCPDQDCPLSCDCCVVWPPSILLLRWDPWTLASRYANTRIRTAGSDPVVFHRYWSAQIQSPTCTSWSRYLATRASGPWQRTCWRHWGSTATSTWRSRRRAGRPELRRSGWLWPWGRRLWERWAWRYHPPFSLHAKVPWFVHLLCICLILNSLPLCLSDQWKGSGGDQDVAVEANGGADRGARPDVLHLQRGLQVSGTRDGKRRSNDLNSSY